MEIFLRSVLAGLCFVGYPACYDANEGSYLTDAAWVSLGSTSAVGAEIQPQELGRATRHRLAAVDFVANPEDPRRFTLKAQLLRRDTMVPTGTTVFGNIDAIAIISIDRHNGDEPYIYQTIQSLLTEVPPLTQINVFVGNHDTDYLSPAVLQEKIGAQFASQVHVVPADEAAWNFLTTHHAYLRNRMTWNYARIMRSYAGSNNLLLLEDDVVWSTNSMSHFDSLIENTQAGVVSVYNHRCQKLPGASKDYLQDIKLLEFPLDWYDKSRRFSCTQGMVYPGQIARDAGDFLALRLGREPSDLLIDEFLRRREIHLGVTQPSMVQHQGVHSTGLGYHHTSHCFTPWMPPVSQSSGSRLD